jgi:putative nucleotidyltransferase with HDIG domain
MAERIRVLFVDDERQVLDGLLRLLRPQRQAWDMVTAGSGTAALAMIATSPVDVVVSDMRMPGMDGAELLTRVKALSPGTIRIILSGQSDREAALRRVGPCHHYLAKPCDFQRLVALITRSWELRRELSDPSLATLAGASPALPSLPEAYRHLVEELQRTEPSPLRIAALVGEDIGMAASLLHMANSAAFGLDRTVSDITDAVALVGLDAVRAMMLAIHVFHAAAGTPPFAADRLWRHSLASARLAREIAHGGGCHPATCATAFTAGLLHDCGQLLLAVRDPSNYARAMESAMDPGGDDISVCERARFGVSHDLLGAWLLHHWELPDEVVEAVAWHHQPGRIPGAAMSALAAVHIADHLLGGVPPGGRHADTDLAARLGLGQRLEGWRALAQAMQDGR